MRWKTLVVAILAFVAMQDLCIAEIDVHPQDAKQSMDPQQQHVAETQYYHDEDGYSHGQRRDDYDHGPRDYYLEREPTSYKHAHKVWLNPGPPGPLCPCKTNCTQLTDKPDAGGCGLIPYDVYEAFTTEFILEFIKLESQLQSLQQSYNNLAMSVSAVEERVALAGLPSAPTNTTQTDNTTNPLCGPPRRIAANSFVIGYLVQDPKIGQTNCSDDALDAFEKALVDNVNIKDLCAGVNNTHVNVTASCNQVGRKASYSAEIEIYSYYPCSYVPWFRAVTKYANTDTPCGDDPSCNCADIAEPVCNAIRSGYQNPADVLIVNDGFPLTIRMSNCGTCLDRGDLFCSPDGYSPTCPISGCAAP